MDANYEQIQIEATKLMNEMEGFLCVLRTMAKCCWCNAEMKGHLAWLSRHANGSGELRFVAVDLIQAGHEWINSLIADPVDPVS